MKKQVSDYLLHNKARLVLGGTAYFSLLENLIDGAKESIHLQTYIYDEDETGITIANALVRAATRGVKVYMLVDAYGSQKLSAAFIKRLTDARIFFRIFHPLFKSRSFYFGRRLHHKLVVIDSCRCTVAGLNISNRYNDTPEAPAWLDWALYVEGEIAPALEEICKSRLRLRYRNSGNVKTITAHRCPVRVRVNDWMRGKRQIYNSYLQMFRTATSHITIMSAYFLPGHQFRRKIEQALERGVKVKVVLTGNADVFMIKYAERYIYRWLFKNKIAVYEYRRNVLHGKLAVCDGEWMTVGSFNVNNLSAFASIELNLDVKEPGFVKEAEKTLSKIIDEDCVMVTEEMFNHRFNAFNKIIHKTAYEIFRFLFFISTKHHAD